MARPLQVLSLLSRLRPLSVTTSSGFASRGASGPWTGQSHVRRDRASNMAPRYRDEKYDEECGLDTEDVEDKLQAVVDETMKKQRTVKFHILRKKMTPPGAPQRKLTWDAMEQIRYLKQEQPEEWTVQRLAEGFSVTPDVILRVLRNKFVPSPERKIKQDAKVMAELSPQALPAGAGAEQRRLKLPGNRTPAALPPGSREGALIPVSNKTLMIGGEGSAPLAKSAAPVTALPTRFTAGIGHAATVTRSSEENSPTNTSPPEEDVEEEDVECWDGQVLTEGELEEFLEMEKPAPVLQVGKDFFDAEGNFLYRI